MCKSTKHACKLCKGITRKTVGVIMKREPVCFFGRSYNTFQHFRDAHGNMSSVLKVVERIPPVHASNRVHKGTKLVKNSWIEGGILGQAAVKSFGVGSDFDYFANFSNHVAFGSDIKIRRESCSGFSHWLLRSFAMSNDSGNHLGKHVNIPFH